MRRVSDCDCELCRVARSRMQHGWWPEEAKREGEGFTESPLVAWRRIVTELREEIRLLKLDQCDPDNCMLKDFAAQLGGEVGWKDAKIYSLLMIIKELLTVTRTSFPDHGPLAFCLCCGWLDEEKGYNHTDVCVISRARKLVGGENGGGSGEK